MITLNCTHCRATLEMDEAFAGGVCRCQHCGTIQTVPKHLKTGENGEGQAVSGRTTTKAAYQTSRYGGTGLDELGDVVTGSGLSRGGSGLMGSMSPSNVVPQDSQAVSYATPRTGQKPKKTLLMIILGGVAALVVLGIIAYFGLSSAKTTGPVVKKTTSGDGGDIEVADPKLPKGPNFLWVDLGGASSVVYVVDRGSSMGETLDKVKASVYRSVESLGSGKKFAVLFWDRNSDTTEILSYPESGLTDTGDRAVSGMRQAFENVVASGQTGPVSALQRAAALNPTDVVLVTVKADDLPDEVVAAVEGTFKGKAKVHALALFNDDGTVMKQIAQKTGGTYHLVTGDELKIFSGVR